MTLSDEIRNEICQKVQAVLDDWQQDEEGFDPELGTGGCCDRVAGAISSVLAQHGYDNAEGGQDGDDHAYTLVFDEDNKVWAVDIDPSVYETGRGYCWKKLPGVQIRPQDIEVEFMYQLKGETDGTR